MFQLNQNNLNKWEKSSTTLHSIVRQTARIYPDRTALVDGPIRLSYHILDLWTDSLAGYLQQMGIRNGNVVGIFMGKCHEYVLASLATLKAGAAYLPLELAYPQALLKYIIEEAQPSFILTKSSLATSLSMYRIPTLEMDKDVFWKNHTPVNDRKVSVTSKDIAIMGYSSGTTGRPKGVPVSHLATLYAHAKFWEEVRSLGASDRFAYTTFLEWDALSPFQVGATGFIVPDMLSTDPKYLAQFIADHQINHTVMTPSLLSSVLNRLPDEIIRNQLKSLNILWLGGEVVLPGLVNRTLDILSDLYLINNYGPVECFVIAQGQLKKNDEAAHLYCPVGCVLKEMEIRILDNQKHPVPLGESGELYASGPCLFDGYLKNEELTHSKFFMIDGKKFFNTGDLAFLLTDGRLVIQGRSDAVVKLRSYHVNLAAIEDVMRKQAQVQDSVVIAYGGYDDQYLVAYVIRDREASWRIDSRTGFCNTIKARLKSFLPSYMIPSVYVELKEFPIHPVSRKIDKGLLPPPPRRFSEGLKKYPPVRPGMPIPLQEELLVEMIEDILQVEKGAVGKEDNLFEIGLHSLSFVKLTMGIEEVFQTEIKVETVFHYPTVQEIVALLNHQALDRPISLRQDVKLDSGIQPASTALPPRTLSAAKTIFLTGATGFLGSFLLTELLERTQADIFCLVRKQKNNSEEKQRIIDRLVYFRLWNPQFEARIIPFSGALEEELFGLSEPQYSEYAAKIDCIFHCAAMVNLLYPYSFLKPVNVTGTQEIIRLASERKIKPLHYLSTLGIFPIREDIYAREDSNITDFAELLDNGYTQSKWVAENIVQEAIQRGLPTVIYRPGNIGADSVSNLGNPKDAQTLIIEACKTLGMTPENTGWFFEVTPVDFIAEAIVTFAHYERHWNQVYHIASTQPISAQEVFNRLHQRGWVRKRVTLKTWIQTLYDTALNKDDLILRLLAETLRLEQQYMGEQVWVDCSAFDQNCAMYQLKRPMLNADYMVR